MIPLGNRVFIAPEIPDKIGRFHLARMSRIMPDTGHHHGDLRESHEGHRIASRPAGVLPQTNAVLADDEKSTMIDAKEILAVLQ